MAGLTIYIDDKDLVKAQKGYSWNDAQKTTPKEMKPQGKYNVVATDRAYMTTQQPKSFQEKVQNTIYELKKDLELMQEKQVPDLEFAANAISNGNYVEFKPKENYPEQYETVSERKLKDPYEAINNYLNIKKIYDENIKHNQKSSEYKKNNLGDFLNDVFSTITFSNFRPFDETQNGLASQLYRYYDRHNNTKDEKELMNTEGADIIDLSKNVIRVTPESKQSTALFNEFVETKNPSIYKAADYKQGKVKKISDQNIPVGNISLYQGVENGHFKVGKLEDFEDNTFVYPVRNIKKKFSAPITQISVEGKNVPDNFGKLDLDDFKFYNRFHANRNGFYDFVDRVINSINKNDHKFLAGNTIRKITKDEVIEEINKSPAWQLVLEDAVADPYDTLLGILDDINNKNKFLEFKKPYAESVFGDAIINVHDQFLSDDFHRNYIPVEDFFYKYRDNFKEDETDIDEDDFKYTVTDVNGKTYPISELNAAILDNKTILGNNNGGIFIGDFKKMSPAQLDSVNAYLAKNPSWLVRSDLGSFDKYRLDSPTLNDYLKQYFENPSQYDPNVYVVGTTQPNKLFTPTKQTGGELDKAQKGTQAKLNIIDNVNEHKFRKLYDSDNKSLYTGFTGRRGEDTNGEVYLANDMSNAEIRKEFPGALIKVENGIKTFRLPKVNEEVVLPKVDNKWTSIVVLPNGKEERQIMALVPEKRTNYIDGYRTTKNGIQNMINFTDPWTLPKWTMAFEDANGKPYSDRYYELQNEYFDNGGKDNPLEYILNKDFDEVKTTGELETLNIPNALWHNTTKGTFMVSDENGNVRYSDSNLSPNEHYSVTDNVKIYRPKKTTITTIDQNAVKRNKFIKEMNDANRLVNMVNAGQNRTWNLQYQQGGPSEILNQVNRSNSNFVQRLKDPYRQTIKDWENRHRVATHKLSVGTDENGNYFVYPEVQEINGKLVDFTKPKFGKWSGQFSAIQNQDTVRFDNFDDALWFTQNYKNYYPSFDKYQQGGQTGLTILIDDEQFKKGGQIHIKEKNKGKFTKQAQSAGMSVQEFARHVLAHKDRYPASTVKRANFARNASKWNK